MPFLLAFIQLQSVFAEIDGISDYKPTMGFVILSHVRTEQENKLWRRCYDSIREFYPNAPVIIIDDNSLLPISDNSLKNTTIIRSEYPGAGELLPYYYFLERQFAQKMVVLHDSMLLRRRFTKKELKSSIKFHWEFTHDWDNDAIINMLLSHLKCSDELIDYNMNSKALWRGCFGAASVIDLDIIQRIEKKYALTSALKTVINNRSFREGFERVFALVMFKEQCVTINNCSNFGDIHTQIINFTYVDDASVEYLKQHSSAAIIKTWHGR